MLVRSLSPGPFAAATTPRPLVPLRHSTERRGRAAFSGGISTSGSTLMPRPRVTARSFAAFTVIQRPMRILIDTDLFCKLGITSLLQDSLRLLGATIEDCARLPALPYMLRRGTLPKRYGSLSCERLAVLADTMPALPAAGAEWLDQLTPLVDINAGEAQLFAAAAERPSFVITGDNRALRALKTLETFASALARHIVVLEALLLALCDDLGHQEVRRRVELLVPIDKATRVWFSPENSDPREALVSYYNSLVADLQPLELWNPRSGGGR
jgi:hypothetical protein